jgi:hypothetical protein
MFCLSCVSSSIFSLVSGGVKNGMLSDWFAIDSWLWFAWNPEVSRVILFCLCSAMLFHGVIFIVALEHGKKQMRLSGKAVVGHWLRLIFMILLGVVGIGALGVNESRHFEEIAFLDYADQICVVRLFSLVLYAFICGWVARIAGEMMLAVVVFFRGTEKS